MVFRMDVILASSRGKGLEELMKPLHPSPHKLTVIYSSGARMHKLINQATNILAHTPNPHDYHIYIIGGYCDINERISHPLHHLRGFKSDRIFKLQKRAARIITCSKYNAHTEPLLKTLNLLKIEDIMKTKALKLYYRYKQNELPKYFESMFTESNDNHSHDTRHKSLLYQLPTKTSTGRLCIRHYIPELLSKTPECITEKLDTHSFSGYSNYIKNYYIRNYNENCLIENCYICQK